MKKIVSFSALIFIALLCMSMIMHKYYLAVFQLDYVPAKKVMQVTSRIFIDDLEAAFVKKYKKNFYLGTSAEVGGANDYLAKYFTEKMHVKINGKEKAIKFLGKETEDDILICYYTISAESAVKSVEVTNTTLLEMFDDQQNIIHAKVKGNKKSLLLTNSETKGLLEF